MPSHVDPEKCVGCGTCAEVCSAGAIKMVGVVPVINEDLCFECGACVIRCPAGARNIVEMLKA